VERTERQHSRILVAQLVGIGNIAEHHGTDIIQSIPVIVITPASGVASQITPDVRLEYHVELVILQCPVDFPVDTVGILFHIPAQHAGQFRPGGTGKKQDNEDKQLFFVH